MNMRSTIVAATMLAFAALANAHDCSGGAEGGMDATGNQCNDATTVLAKSAGPEATGNYAKRNNANLARPVVSRTTRDKVAPGAQRVASKAAESGR